MHFRPNRFDSNRLNGSCKNNFLKPNYFWKGNVLFFVQILVFHVSATQCMENAVVWFFFRGGRGVWIYALAGFLTKNYFWFWQKKIKYSTLVKNWWGPCAKTRLHWRKNTFREKTCKSWHRVYSVMQSDGNSFCGYVVLDIFNMVYSDEDSI